MLKGVFLLTIVASFLCYTLSCHRISAVGKTTSLRAAVGIALHADHLTLSERSSYGGYWDMARLEGISEYRELMERLSSSTTRHLSPPYSSWKDMIRDQPRQSLRAMRKKLGLPASSDVGILVQMLQRVVDALPYELDEVICVISYPALPGLEPEDITDAMLHLGISTRYQTGFPPHEIVAAYAGHGMGLCKSAENDKKCKQEMESLPYRDTLLVEYTETAMFLHARKMHAAIDSGHADTMTASFSMGSDGSPSAEDIRDFVLEFLRENHDVMPPESSPEEVIVLVVGSEESVSGEALIGVKGAITAYGSHAKMYYLHPDYIAARGAAEIAWRSFFTT